MDRQVIALALLIAEVQRECEQVHPLLGWLFVRWLRARVWWITFRYSGR